MNAGSRRYRVVHTTRYEYALPVELCHNEVHLKPRASVAQRCLESEVTIRPAPESLRERVDYFGNPVATFVVKLPERCLTVTASSLVEVSAPAETETVAPSPPWEEVRSRVAGPPWSEVLEALEFTLDSPMVASSAALRAWAEPSFPAGRPLLEAVADLTRRIHREIAYDPGFTTVATPAGHVLERRRGVCQDFAHLAIGCLRSMGLPARYVSGYLETAVPAGAKRLRGADASHAWFSAFAPGVGWFDFDPTNDQIPPRQHVTTAWGRDYADVTPLKGVLFGGGDHSLEVSVDVERIEDGTTP